MKIFQKIGKIFRKSIESETESIVMGFIQDPNVKWERLHFEDSVSGVVEVFLIDGSSKLTVQTNKILFEHEGVCVELDGEKAVFNEAFKRFSIDLEDMKCRILQKMW